jgi:riboflavin kinase
MKLTGIVSSGIGQGAQFLALDWVAKELRRVLDLSPFPGTLNLRVAPRDREALFLQREKFLRIADAASPDCPGYLKNVELRAHGRSVDAAWVILPEKTIHTDVLEFISAVNLRQQLALNDSDAVEVEMS